MNQTSKIPSVDRNAAHYSENDRPGGRISGAVLFCGRAAERSAMVGVEGPKAWELVREEPKKKKPVPIKKRKEIQQGR